MYQLTGQERDTLLSALQQEYTSLNELHHKAVKGLSEEQIAGNVTLQYFNVKINRTSKLIQKIIDHQICILISTN